MEPLSFATDKTVKTAGTGACGWAPKGFIISEVTEDFATLQKYVYQDAARLSRA